VFGYAFLGKSLFEISCDEMDVARLLLGLVEKFGY